MIIHLSLSPLATKTGWVIAVSCTSFEGSGIPQRVIASSWASRVAMSVGSSRNLPNSELRIYPDSGHGFLDQYPQLFADHVNSFLNGG